MRLSRLQKHIILRCYEKKGRINRRQFYDFYEKSKKLTDDEVKIISKSLNRLIDRGLLVGYALKTKEKLYIRDVRSTALGKRTAKAIIDSKQKKLPLKKISRNLKSRA